MSAATRNADAKVRMHLAKSETLRERIIGAARAYYSDDCDTGSNALNAAISEYENHLDNPPKEVMKYGKEK